jgi:ABC-type multidrug transport system ATPase subunit
VGEAAYCDLVGVMVKGRLVALETPDGLRRRAFGGEVVDMTTKERLLHQDLKRLNEWCRQEYVPVESIEPYLPPYDDVFVELVKDVGHEA